MPIAVLHQTIDSLPESYIEKVSDYVNLLLLQLQAESKTAIQKKSIAEKKVILKRLEKYMGILPSNFDYKKAKMEHLKEKYGFIS